MARSSVTRSIMLFAKVTRPPPGPERRLCLAEWWNLLAFLRTLASVDRRLQHHIWCPPGGAVASLGFGDPRNRSIRCVGGG